jgi:signal transduction histidine kinase
MEYRLRRYDGEYRWIQDSGVPIFNPNGSFIGYIGSCVDITDRKKVVEGLRSISGKLIQAQEQERRRIARELHDDFNQRLALLAIEIQRLKDAPDSAAALNGRIEDLFKRITEISSGLQALSHHLHSSSLEYLGLSPAAAGFCSEFARVHDVKVDFNHQNIPSTLPSEVALGIFRVLQEGLQNALKYSGVRQFEARLLGIAGEIQLVIRDTGVGFDPDVALKGPGLGLVSMRERVHLLNGSISIASGPKSGTEIIAHFPIPD